VQVANGVGLSIMHVGHSRLHGSSSPIKLKNILHVPGLSNNLLSVHRLMSNNNIFVEFHKFFFVSRKWSRRKYFFMVGVVVVSTLFRSAAP
jgi:hypothetical protein